MCQLENILKSLMMYWRRGHISQRGNHYLLMNRQSGIAMPSLVFLFTGGSIVFRHSQVNGIPEICISKVHRSMSII